MEDDRPWTVWYHDTFDRETEPSEEARGVGAAAGLAELWRKHLREGVQDDGRLSFSRFHLNLESPREVVDLSNGSPAGCLALRRWKDDPQKLRLLARAHASLGRPDEIFRLAEQARDEAELLRRLEEI